MDAPLAAGEDADEVDVTARSRGVERLLEGPRAADPDDVVDAAGRLGDGVAPS